MSRFLRFEFPFSPNFGLGLLCLGLSQSVENMELAASVWLDTIGGIASLLGLAISTFGLVYSVKAAAQAKSAREAADEALKALRHRDAAEEISGLVELAAQLSHFLENRDRRGASVRATDLSGGIQTLATRRQPFVQAELEQLSLMSDQLVRVGRSLATNGIPEDPREFSLLFGRCQKAHSILSGLVGRVQREIEDPDHEYR